jgi:hypothetical protein
MINLTYGSTNSVWLSLREMLPAGMTAPSYKFEFTREVTGTLTTFTASDISTAYMWSNFIIGAGPVDIAPNIYKLMPGNYSYKVIEDTSGKVLEVGRMIVEDGPITWNVRPNSTPKANVRVYKKN